MSVGRQKNEYENFEEQGTGASNTLPSLPLDSMDPGAHIEMSAAVPGVVPDGKLGHLSVCIPHFQLPQ